MNAQLAQYAKEHPEAVEKGQEHLQKILARSATDREFRQKLLTDPRAAISEFAGREVSNVDIKFIENQGAATVVLPDYVGESAELSENELEAVAGGGTPVLALFIPVGAALAAAYDAYN